MWKALEVRNWELKSLQEFMEFLWAWLHSFETYDISAEKCGLLHNSARQYTATLRENVHFKGMRRKLILFFIFFFLRFRLLIFKALCSFPLSFPVEALFAPIFYYLSDIASLFFASAQWPGILVCRSMVHPFRGTASPRAGGNISTS